MPELAATLTDVEASAAALARSAAVETVRLSDDELLEFQRRLSRANRSLETASAALAAEIEHRSRRELGYDGLAQRHGFRTPEAMVQHTTGSTSATARRLVRVGTMIADLKASESDPAQTVAEPWLIPAIAAVTTGALSTGALEAIRAGLGAPTDAVSADALADATRKLTAEAADVTIERLAAMAREARDQLDEAGVQSREQERRDKRYLRLIPQIDGMTRLVGLLDPESAAAVTTAIDAATSPRRGGPRFVREEDIARAEALVADERTAEQIALDALVEMVGVASRSKNTVGISRPAVRMLVTLRDLEARRGVGHIEGQTATVSIPTIERAICESGYLPILFTDDGQSLNLGRTKRLHNARQRKIIAARDGGCIAPECQRPPSWCEVHHIDEYSKGGKTDVSLGVLLCRHHHLLVHNNGWRVTREGGRYWMTPPPDIDRDRQPIPLPTKSAAMRRLLRTG